MADPSQPTALNPSTEQIAAWMEPFYAMNREVQKLLPFPIFAHGSPPPMTNDAPAPPASGK